MSRKPIGFLFAAAVLLATGCASTGAQRSSGSPDKLTHADIEDTNVTSAYDAVNRLRPNWLRPAGMSVTGLQNGGAPPVLVYMDGKRLGGTDVLKTITTSSVVSMEFLSPTRAPAVVNDMSTGAVSAVIMIYTK